MFNGKIHYFDWAIFNSYVKLPEGIQWYSMIGTQGRQLDTTPVAEFPAAAMAGISGSFAIDHWQISL